MSKFILAAALSSIAGRPEYSTIDLAALEVAALASESFVADPASGLTPLKIAAVLRDSEGKLLVLKSNDEEAASFTLGIESTIENSSVIWDANGSIDLAGTLQVATHSAVYATFNLLPWSMPSASMITGDLVCVPGEPPRLIVAAEVSDPSNLISNSSMFEAWETLQEVPARDLVSWSQAVADNAA